MKMVTILSGNAPCILKYQAGATFAYSGLHALVAGSGGYGVQKESTTAAVSQIGVTLDTATPSNSQATDNSDTERLLSIIINPDAIYRAKLSGAATENTTITEGVEATGSTNGLLVDTQEDYSNPTLDEGLLFCTYGANQGLARKVTSLSSANAVNITAWPRDIAVGDKFIRIPFSFMDKQFVQMSTNLFQVDTSVAVDTDNANWLPVKLIPPASPGDYTTNMQIDMIQWDSIFAAGAQ